MGIWSSHIANDDFIGTTDVARNVISEGESKLSNIKPFNYKDIYDENYFSVSGKIQEVIRDTTLRLEKEIKSYLESNNISLEEWKLHGEVKWGEPIIKDNSIKQEIEVYYKNKRII